MDVVVYYSGHADDRGLMLGREMLPYTELRSALSDVAADVGITILDACASGAITRLKGGRPHPAFLTDASSQVKGYAFLTSSSENEAAQESERLQGSFFTQALLTGLRGAADVSGDGRVTLGEAYQFAFAETLAQTTSTQGGAQHPAYDIKMAGTGDVVLTDVRQTSSSLVFGPDYDGRFFVLGPRRQLVAELFKPSGRTSSWAWSPANTRSTSSRSRSCCRRRSSSPTASGRSSRASDLHPTQAVADAEPRRRRAPRARPARRRTRVQIGFGVSQISGSSTCQPGPCRTEVTAWAGRLHHALGPPGPGPGLRPRRHRRHRRVDPDLRSHAGDLRLLAGARYYPPLSRHRPPLRGARPSVRSADSASWTECRDPSADDHGARTSEARSAAGWTRFFGPTSPSASTGG